MIRPPGPWSLQESLLALTSDAMASAPLTRLAASNLPEAAAELVDRDVYRCGTIARRALALCGVPEEAAAELAYAHVEHLLWCSWRTARSLTGECEAERWTIEGRGHLTEVAERPTIVISPMTLPLCETASLIGHLFPGREVVGYGRGAETLDGLLLPANFRLHGDGISSLRAILGALHRGAVYCTYPDYVFTGHEALSGSLFGMPRSYSSAFVSLCCRPGVHLLPVLAFREGEERVARVGEPMVLELPGPRQDPAIQQAVLQILGAALEEAIVARPEQWLLLGTLAAESVEVASPRATAKEGVGTTQP